MSIVSPPVKGIIEAEGTEYAKEIGEISFKTIKNGYEILYKDLYSAIESSEAPDEVLEVPETYADSFVAGKDIMGYIVDTGEGLNRYDMIFMGSIRLEAVSQGILPR